MKTKRGNTPRKCNVHLFAVVRLKREGIRARSHEEAVQKAQALFDQLYDTFDGRNLRRLPSQVTAVEFGEEFSHFLVDETNDPGFERSTWHDAHGKRQSRKSKGEIS